MIDADPAPGCTRKSGTPAIANTSLRLGVVALLCAGLVGCQAMVVDTLRDISRGDFPPQLPRMEERLCSELTGKGITVTKALETAIPTNEGEARMFEPAFWSEQFTNPTAGNLAATDRSVLFVPSEGVAGIRIPYELVTSVELQQGSFTSASPAIIVKSLCGRIDTFTLPQSQDSINVDPNATMAAATHLKSRVAAFQATTLKVTDTPH